MKKLFLIFTFLITIQYATSAQDSYVLGVLSTQEAYSVIPATFGTPLNEDGFLAPIVLSLDTSLFAATTSCDTITQSLTGRIAVIDRGICQFSRKCLQAQRAGALAVIIINNNDSTGAVLMTDGDFGQYVHIPCFSISHADGIRIKAALPSYAALQLNIPPPPDSTTTDSTQQARQLPPLYVHSDQHTEAAATTTLPPIQNPSGQPTQVPALLPVLPPITYNPTAPQPALPVQEPLYPISPPPAPSHSDSALSIFPNPSDQYTQLLLSTTPYPASPVTLQVFDPLGRLHYTTRIYTSTSYTLHTAQWASGTYTLQLQNAHSQTIHKLIIIH
jgi:hypothetical protein